MEIEDDTMSNRDIADWTSQYLKMTGDAFYHEYRDVPIGSIPRIKEPDYIILEAVDRRWRTEHVILLFDHLTSSLADKGRVACKILTDELSSHLIDIQLVRMLLRYGLDHKILDSDRQGAAMMWSLGLEHTHDSYVCGSLLLTSSVVTRHIDDVVDLLRDGELRFILCDDGKTYRRLTVYVIRAVIYEMLHRGIFGINMNVNRPMKFSHILFNDEEFVMKILNGISDSTFNSSLLLAITFCASKVSIGIFLDRLEQQHPCAVEEYFSRLIRTAERTSTVLQEVLHRLLSTGPACQWLPSMRLLTARIPPACLTARGLEGMTTYEMLCKDHSLVGDEDAEEFISLFAPRLPKSAYT